jgi:PLP dependent protein
MIASNIALVRERIEKAAKRSKRNPEDITLVCVTKTAEPKQIEEALSAGVVDIAENRVQAALSKYSHLGNKARDARWHMIGHLQTNKVSKSLKIFNTIHSLDSVKLANEINRHAGLTGKSVDCFVEVNISQEQSKYGILPTDIFAFMKRLSSLEHIRIIGLMAMAPFVDRAEHARPYFRKMRLLRDELSIHDIKNSGIKELSMGMTQDFEIAIEEGATFIRVGSAIFSEQDSLSPQ